MAPRMRGVFLAVQGKSLAGVAVSPVLPAELLVGLGM